MEFTKYVFDEFELDTSAFELQRRGERVRLERIPMDLLLLLISRRGEVVTREEIIEKLWGSDVFIDTNTAINVAVRKVRQALEDSIEAPRYILTVPAKGYRFIGAVSSSSARDIAGLTTDAGVSADRLAAAEPDIPEQSHRTGTEAAIAALEPSVAPERSDLASRRWLIGLIAVGLGVVLFLVVRSRHAAPAGKVMFAVLPFVNLTGDPAQEYIADGMTEEMITQMGALNPERIGVIARTSAMRFKGTQKDAAVIARELGVGYLLEGSIRHVGERVRVTAQLIEASDQTHLWAADYDSDFSDLLRLESDIAGAIANQVRVRLDSDSRPQFVRPVRPEAQSAYLRGLEDWNLRTNSSIVNAISEFQQAIAADQSYPLPYAALARCYVLGPIFGVGDPLESMPRARELAEHALELDPGLAEAHSMLAMVAAHYDYDWATAEREFLTAMQLNPSDPYAHLFYSNSFLSPHGRHAEAIGEMQKAIALDPLSPALQSYLIRTYVWARRDGDAQSQFEKTNEVAPNLGVLHERAAHLFASQGNFPQAIEEDGRARLLSGEEAEQVIARKARQMTALTQHGAQGYWQAQLDLSKERPNPPEAFVTLFGVAVIYARLGRRDLALGALDQAFEHRDVQLTETNVEPAFDTLRSDPRFGALLRRIHLG